MQWIRRDTVTYKIEELPLGDGDDIIDPSIVRLMVFGHTYPIDVGSWCYTSRKKLSKNKLSEDCAIVLVESGSFREQRVDFVKKFLEYLYCQIGLRKSIKSMASFVWQFQIFLVWCDANSIEALDGREQFLLSVRKYTEYLIDGIRRNVINNNTGASYQGIIFSIGKAVYNDPYGDIFKSIRRIRRSQAATYVTEKPDVEAAAKEFRLYKGLFDQLSRLVVERLEFPLKITLEHDEYWFFPNPLPFVGVNEVEASQVLAERFHAYNYESGEIRSVDEIIARLKCVSVDRRYYAKKRREEALQSIQYANDNPYHDKRVLAASLALQSFVMMFAANTGMSLGLMASLQWDDGLYDMHRERQGFRTIKYRANGKLVSFLIGSSFVGSFRRFLELRGYLISAFGLKTYPRLFFGVVSGELRELAMNFTTVFHLRVKRYFNFEPSITTRMWRANKSDWLIRNSDISTASIVLQNSPETVIRHYAQGSQVEADNEITKFFSVYKSGLIAKRNESLQPISVGQCRSVGNPKPLEGGLIPPDCGKPEGCLFCENYRIHADKVDIVKLYSCKYVIELARTASHSEEHFFKLFGPVLKRIDEIIDFIVGKRLLDADDILKIKKDVFELERLDFYWLNKLRLLEDLGVV